MSDPTREKFAHLIEMVEAMEDLVEAIEAREGADSGQAELAAAREKLQQARDELSRVSNGCGSPRTR